MRMLKENQRKALWEIVALGQYSGAIHPSRAERKAAKWAFRVLHDHGDLALEQRPIGASRLGPT